MRLYLNNLTDQNKKCDELKNTVVCTSGYDRMKFVNPRTGTAGDLGFDTWIEHWNKPSYNADMGSGSLVAGEYYAIKVVPVDRKVIQGADFQRGTPTLYSMPAASSGGNGITWNIPTHTQLITHDCGDATATAAGTMTDSGKAWTTDQWAGYLLLNVETGITYPITANTATVITATGVTTGNFAVDDRYQIVDYKATARDVYAAHIGATESDVTAAVFHYQGTVEDNTTTTYDLGSFVLSGIFTPDDNIPPERYAWCRVTDNRVFACGGIQDSRGLCKAITSVATINASATANEQIAVAVQTDLYSGAGSGRVVRYTLGSALTPPTDMYIGSYVTVSSSEDSGNDAVDAQIIRVADDNTWFEIVNNTGVDNTDDEAMQLDITPNVIVASTTGGSEAYFTDGMLYGDFNFDDEIIYNIHWVDPINGKLTLSQKYAGDTTTDSAYTIATDYDLAWSDYGDPHVWRSENSNEISDDKLAVEVFNGLLLVFCRNSLWKVPVSNLVQTPLLVSDDINFSAPHSIVLTPRGVMFHDGFGFSVTDGNSVVSITQYKATELMAGINPAMAYNIRGEYDSINRRVEYVFPYGSDVTNNNGIYITIDSLNIYPFSRLDSNVVWEDEDSDGRAVMMHGTSGRHVTSGSGTVWMHDPDMATDGEFGSSSTFGTISSVETGYLVVDFDDTVTLGEGTYCLFMPETGTAGTMVSFIAENVTNVSGNQYNVYFSDDWYSDAFTAGGYVYLCMIPFDYGIKWLDFASPQYQHKVRMIQMDVRDFVGVVVIEHYGDLNEAVPVQVDTVSLVQDDTKIIVKIKKGSYYTYGFRLRGYSSTRGRILSFEVLFDTEV